MKTFFIISSIVLWALIITFVLWLLYDDIRYRIRMHRLYKKAFQELDEQEKGIINKLKKD